MKFTDGYWNVKEHVTIYNPMEVRDVKKEPGRLTVYAACKKVRHRGDTLNEPLITVEYFSPASDVIGIRMYHHKGGIAEKPVFPLNIETAHNIDVFNKENEAGLSSGQLSVRIQKNEWAVDFLWRGKRITGNGYKNPGYIIDRPSGRTYMREQLDLDVGELVYGLGERFTPFVKNGQTVDIWNEDGGTSSEIAYKNIPFYITNKGYGVFVNNPGPVSYEIASENVSKAQFSVPGESLEYFIIGGDTLKDVLNKYTSLTGKPALPPAWSFGLWLTTSFTTSYDESTVNSFIDGMISRDLPLHVFHFDCFWMKEYQWCDFEWDSDVFPDPEGMLNRLKSKGLKICVWINPYIAQKSYLFDEGMKNGYLLKNRDGGVWQCDKWQAGMGLVDFTNPDAVSWYKGKLKRLLDMGVDCFKTDFGERIPTDAVYFDGSDPVRMHNFYTYLYNKAVYEVIADTRGKNDAVLFARSATAGSQKFPVHWGGDCTAYYTSMAESLRGGLSLCLSGFGFWSHDISGFDWTATPDIYKRWTAFGLLSTHSRLHGNNSYRVPWLFDEEAVDVLRHFTTLKCRLMPYLYAAACEASRKGIPVMRAMILEFIEDPTCHYLDRQYMLGNSLLVAPIFNEHGRAEYYLPEGTWTNFLSGEKVEGGHWISETHNYMSLPLMVRPNSIIPVGNIDTKPDYDFADNVVLHVFELQDDSECGAVVCNMAGDPELNVKVKKAGNTILINANGTGKPWRLLLRGFDNLRSVSGGEWSKKPEGVLVTPASGENRLEIYI